MNYLLWLPSVEEFWSESFVLFKTNAEKELAENFIENYFREYQVLLTMDDVSRYDEKNMDVKLINQEEIQKWFAYKRNKEETETKQQLQRTQYVEKWLKEERKLNEKLRELNKEEEAKIYEYIDPYDVTKELVHEMKQKGLEKSKTKNGKVRFRRVDHQKIRAIYSEKREKIKEEIQQINQVIDTKIKAYKETNEIKQFEPIEIYKN